MRAKIDQTFTLEVESSASEMVNQIVNGNNLDVYMEWLRPRGWGAWGLKEKRWSQSPRPKRFTDGSPGFNLSLQAGYGLLQWVLAMVKYYEVAKGVAPKRELVNKLQQKKEEAEECLAQTMARFLLPTQFWMFKTNVTHSCSNSSSNSSVQFLL